MRTGTSLLALAGIALALPAPVLAQAAPPAFAACAACHNAAPGGPRKMGPELSGVAGKPAAGKPGVIYSRALKTSGIVWTDAKLDAFLAAPAKTVPGTNMIYPGLHDAKARADVIAYLKTLR